MADIDYYFLDNFLNVRFSKLSSITYWSLFSYGSDKIKFLIKKKFIESNLGNLI